MAELQGNWVPETEAERAYIAALSTVVEEYNGEVASGDMASALNYVAASVLMAEQAPEEPRMPKPPEKREECPECDEPIESTTAFIGGMAIVGPCGCEVDAEKVSGWLDNVGGDDDE